MSTALQRGEHGVTAWRLGCRCNRCHAALHRRAKVWWATAQVRRGRNPATYTSARPVRRYIAALEASGLTRAEIARRAQVAPATITRLAKSSTRWCSRITARDVLAVGA